MSEEQIVESKVGKTILKAERIEDDDLLLTFTDGVEIGVGYSCMGVLTRT